MPIHDIIAQVAADHGVPIRHILGPSRLGPIVRARHAAMCAVRILKPGVSLPAIGRIFGRHHTTVMHGIRKASGHEGAARKLELMKIRGRA